MEWLTRLFTDANTAPAAFGLVGLLIVLVAVFALLQLRNARSGLFLSGGRHRRQRLAVIDATAIDNRRRLVLVRRDNVEHLILIGGGNDLVIEPAIQTGKDKAEPVADARKGANAENRSQRHQDAVDGAERTTAHAAVASPPADAPRPATAVAAGSAATVATIAAEARPSAPVATGTDTMMEDELARALDEALPLDDTMSADEPAPMQAQRQSAPMVEPDAAPVATVPDDRGTTPAVVPAPSAPSNTSPTAPIDPYRDEITPASAAIQPLPQSAQVAPHASPEAGGDVAVVEPDTSPQAATSSPDVAPVSQATPDTRAARDAKAMKTGKPTDALDVEMKRLLSELTPERD